MQQNKKQEQDRHGLPKFISGIVSQQGRRESAFMSPEKPAKAFDIEQSAELWVCWIGSNLFHYWLATHFPSTFGAVKGNLFV